MRGKATGRLEDQLESIASYDKALVYAQTGPYVHLNREPTSEGRAPVAQQIRLARAVSQVLTGDDKHIAEAKSLITSFVLGRAPWAHGWKASNEMSGELLYSLGCWYATAIDERFQVPEPIAESVRFVIYGIARDETLGEDAAQDPDLRLISQPAASEGGPTR